VTRHFCGAVQRACLSAALLLSLVFVRPVHAQRGVDWSTRPVLLLTMGQGDAVFEKFGHNAIVVWDDAAGMPLVYNWGLFDFEQPNFIGRFLSGDTKYWMAPATMAQTMRQYESLNRTVVAQELQLTPEQKVKLAAALATSALEANKYYRYDYYRDNCSTRARDAIDAVTGGVVRRAMLAQPGQGSYRWHTRRLLGYSAPLYYGIQLVLGVDADTPLNGWQEAFLPQSLHESMKRIELPASGTIPARPIVGSTDTLFRAARGPEPTTASSHLLLSAVIGIVLAAILLGMTKLGKFGAAIAIGGWSLLCAVLGCALLLAWFATQHVFMANNPSVALMNPGWLVGVAAAVAAARGGVSKGVRSALRWLLIIGVVGAAGAVLLGHPGSALELAALLLPGHAAVVWAADRWKRASAHAPQTV
jgi:Domain of unknown function (DUF4105)